MSNKQTMTNRELAFQRYLQALDAGDADGILHFLELAETDEQLEAMMLSYHADETAMTTEPIEETKIMPINDSVTITHPKRKRKPKNSPSRRWLWGAVASGIIVLIGAYFLLGATLNRNTLPADITCAGVVEGRDNVVLFYGEETGRRMYLEAGVNEPFTIFLTDNQNESNYVAIYDGMTAFLPKDEINLRGDCAEETRVTVYPYTLSINDTCNVFIQDDRIDAYEVRVTEDAAPREGGLTIYEPLTLTPLDNGDFAFEVGYLTGIAEGENIWLRGDCDFEPLLYVPDPNNAPRGNQGWGWHD
ncbi:MAG: hypothetical protein AAFR81_21140 [Chloroflexota bacterium]